MMAATTVFLAGASVAGGWAVYERWWRSCVAEDPLAASCIEAQDHAFLYDLFQRFDGLPPLIVAYGLQYGLAAVAFLLLPFAVGASRGMRAVGVGVAACYGLLATEALLSPAAADPFFGQAPYDLVVVWVLVMLFAFIAPLPAVLALEWDRLLEHGLGRRWPVLFAVAMVAGTPFLYAYFWPAIAGFRSFDAPPWSGVATSVATAAAALVTARVTALIATRPPTPGSVAVSRLGETPRARTGRSGRFADA